MSGLKILLQKKFLNKKKSEHRNSRKSKSILTTSGSLNPLISENTYLPESDSRVDIWCLGFVTKEHNVHDWRENYKLFLNVIQRWNYSRSFNWLLSYQLSITYCYLIVYRTKSCLNTQNCTCIKKGWKKEYDWLTKQTPAEYNIVQTIFNTMYVKYEFGIW